MKNKNLKMKCCEICSNKSLASPTINGNTSLNEIDRVMWEKPYISSKNHIEFDNQIFGYQLIIQGHIVTDKDGHETYYALCKVKVYPLTLNLCDNRLVCVFVYDPIRCVSTCHDMKIKWKEGNIKIPVLYKEEFTPDEVYQKSLCLIENFITGEYLPEIEKRFSDECCDTECSHK